MKLISLALIRELMLRRPVLQRIAIGRKSQVTLSRKTSFADDATKRINRSRREAGILWQPRFFDRALRRVGEYNEKVQYIHLNPVKAGLVKRAEDWPWSSVHDYTGNINDAPLTAIGLAINRVLLPADERTRI